MDGERWQRISALFDAAWAQAPERRAAFLREECQGDRALLDEVESLLENYGRHDGLLPSQAQPAADTERTATGPTELAAGVEFGPYVILRTLGVGGMGEVYLARDTRLQRLVALKLLGAWLDLDPRMVERFRQEALAASALRHPNIPVVFEAGMARDRHFIAIEYIEGESLRQRLTRGPLDWRSAVAIAVTLAQALAAAHAAGIIHRDVKPGNILLDPAGQPHLVDFGIAKLLADPKAERAQAAGLTMTGAQLGTPGFMAPEQQFGEAVGPAADIWGLAAVLVAMLTGKPPAPGAIGKGRDRAIPPTLWREIDRALQPDPLQRHPGMDAFAQALTQVRPLRLPHRTARLLTVLLAFAMVAGAGMLLPRLAAPPTRLTVALPSLAVLPFENLTAGKDDTFFALGIQDELLTRLSRVSGLRVLDRHATDHSVPHPADLTALGARLLVDHFLEGSVQRHDGRVLVHVRLIDVATQAQLWAQRFEREDHEIFAIERDVAEAVAARLNAELHPGERKAVGLEDTISPAAHEAALRGRYLYRHGEDASLKAAVQEFETAVRLDPGYAQAYADLALARHNLDDFLTGDLQENREKSRAAARRSIELAPELPDGHVALGWGLKFWDWDLVQARQEFERADALAPNSPRAINGLAALMMDLGDFPRARQLFEQARSLDPLSGTTTNNLANLMLATGQWDAAERLSREALQLEPKLESGHANLAYVALARGDLARALAEAEAEPSPDWHAFMLTLVRQWQAKSAEADRLQREFEREHGTASPFMVASLYARRGLANQAFAWLERAAQIRDPATIEILASNDMALLRSDPRFASFCRRIGLPDAPRSGGLRSPRQGSDVAWTGSYGATRQAPQAHGEREADAVYLSLS